MARRFKRQLNGLLLAAGVLLICCATALALSTGSIRVILQDSANQPVYGINVELFKVAAASGGGYALEPDFAELGVTVDALAADPGAANAELVYQYVVAMDLGGDLQITGTDGTAEFTDLDEGVYLVMERGLQTVSFAPYLVVMPTEVGGVTHHNVVTAPKTSDVDTTSILVEKIWEDDMDAAGKRPTSLEVTVLRDGAPFRVVTLSAANNWQHTFYMLPNEGDYTVAEEAVTDYEAEIIPVYEGYLIVNTYTPAGPGGGGGGGGGGVTPPTPPPVTAHVVVTKQWEDDDDAAGKRPASVTVQLIEDGTVIRTAVLNETNGWSYTFTKLDPEKDYTVLEIAAEGYTAAYGGSASSGILITNTYSDTPGQPGKTPEPEKPVPTVTDIPVTVIWVDDDNAAKKRPEFVAVSLLADSSIVSSITMSHRNSPAASARLLSAGVSTMRPGGGASAMRLGAAAGGRAVRLTLKDENVWKSAFTGVPADLYYSVWEDPVPEYTTTYSGDAATGFVITNTYTEGVTDPGVPPEPTPPATVQPEDDPLTPGPSEEDPLEKPDEEEPKIPQTGQEVLPVYAMMAAGILFVLLGLTDLCRRQECCDEED